MTFTAFVFVEIQEGEEEQTESRRAGERQKGEGEFIDSLKKGMEHCDHFMFRSTRIGLFHGWIYLHVGLTGRQNLLYAITCT